MIIRSAAFNRTVAIMIEKFNSVAKASTQSENHFLSSNKDCGRVVPSGLQIFPTRKKMLDVRSNSAFPWLKISTDLYDLFTRLHLGCLSNVYLFAALFHLPFSFFFAGLEFSSHLFNAR